MGNILLLPEVIDDGRIDTILKLIHFAKIYSNEKKELTLDWSKTKTLSPAGYAIMACVFDFLVEQKTAIKNRRISKKLLDIPVISNFKNIKNFTTLSNPDINNIENISLMVKGVEGGINTLFTERLDEIFSDKISEDILYASKLIINELMQNSQDHSTAERYYMYAGLWNKEFHSGLLDMGITIPAKLEQKYIRQNDIAYLELSFEKGSSTRRQRTGGFGLHYFFEFLKKNEGKLTLVSRNAQIRRYFKTRRSQKNILKYPLPGTWCFARFSLEEK
ncbi:MAG: hypothetical protein HY877_05885 [Deltaproteobacteria bacterium]|nr:hypothetical protein [Deltaproteobacteria bacterium]